MTASKIVYNLCPSVCGSRSHQPVKHGQGLHSRVHIKLMHAQVDRCPDAFTHGVGIYEGSLVAFGMWTPEDGELHVFLSGERGGSMGSSQFCDVPRAILLGFAEVIPLVWLVSVIQDGTISRQLSLRRRAHGQVITLSAELIPDGSNVQVDELGRGRPIMPSE